MEIFDFLGMLACLSVGLIAGWLLRGWTKPDVTEVIIERPVDLQKIRAAAQPRDEKGHFVKQKPVETEDTTE